MSGGARDTDMEETADGDDTASRRRVLAAAAAVASTGVAGCSALGGDGTATDGDGSDGGDGTAAGDLESGMSEDGTDTGGDGSNGGTATDGADGGTATSESAAGDSTATAGGEAVFPLHRLDAANTADLGRNGPTSEATPAWSVATGNAVFDTPSVAGGTVYVGSADGTLYALGTDGSERWTYGVNGGINRTAVGDGVVVGGYVDDGTGYVGVSTEGSEQWRVPTDSRPVGAPAIVDGTAYVSEYNGPVHAIDTASGEVDWTASLATENASTPAVADGTVYVGTLDGVFALDAATGDRQWHYEAETFVSLAPAVADGAVFFGDRDGNLTAVETDGTERWSIDVDGTIVCSPAVADDLLYVTLARQDGERLANTVAAYDIGDSGQSWSTQDGQGVWSSPVVAGELVYAADATAGIHAYTADDGETQWSWSGTDSAAPDIVPAPAVTGDTVYVGSYDNSVYALRP